MWVSFSLSFFFVFWLVGVVFDCLGLVFGGDFGLGWVFCSFDKEGGFMRVSVSSRIFPCTAVAD